MTRDRIGGWGYVDLRQGRLYAGCYQVPLTVLGSGFSQASAATPLIL